LQRVRSVVEGLSIIWLELSEAFCASAVVESTVDVSFAVAGCDFQQQMEKRASFNPDAPLIRHGLIKWDSCSQPDGPEILSSSFAISAQAFAVLVGEDS
jgi:hypothetical protein